MCWYLSNNTAISPGCCCCCCYIHPLSDSPGYLSSQHDRALSPVLLLLVDDIADKKERRRANAIMQIPHDHPTLLQSNVRIEYYSIKSLSNGKGGSVSFSLSLYNLFFSKISSFYLLRPTMKRDRSSISLELCEQETFLLSII